MVEVGVGRVENSFGLCFELLASIFMPPLTQGPYLALLKAADWSQQIAVWGLGEVGGTPQF